jgi:hypothetical protein
MIAAAGVKPSPKQSGCRTLRDYRPAIAAHQHALAWRKAWKAIENFGGRRIVWRTLCKNHAAYGAAKLAAADRRMVHCESLAIRGCGTVRAMVANSCAPPQGARQKARILCSVYSEAADARIDPACKGVPWRPKACSIAARSAAASIRRQGQD